MDVETSWPHDVETTLRQRRIYRLTTVCLMKLIMETFENLFSVVTHTHLADI